MYRIAKRNEELILRFLPKLNLSLPVKEEICKAITAGQPDVSELASTGNALLFLKNLGAVAIDVERVPSLVLTVTAVIPKDRWFTYGED
ncbi:hypothetical protein A8F94_03015 [Bacillus sp. FJAT-27225]|uniref:hypothetical protein n=1 Tax=Bacillus sp. FJAT-27225 TaxID=1743144 RepID=UPI00080C2D41|nr:hypothetical protein [Bacillus sp. FJAT-27225]OCA90859.1 hypothetical protein A8F94_03015 [Bacillus sp. FJAT-27225]